MALWIEEELLTAGLTLTISAQFVPLQQCCGAFWRKILEEGAQWEKTPVQEQPLAPKIRRVLAVAWGTHPCLATSTVNTTIS